MPAYHTPRTGARRRPPAAGQRLLLGSAPSIETGCAAGGAGATQPQTGRCGLAERSAARPGHGAVSTCAWSWRCSPALISGRLRRGSIGSTSG